MKKTIVLLLLSLAVAASAIFLIVRHSLQEEGHSLFEPSLSLHTITLTEDGFIPKELVVRENDTVTFVTTRGMDFWPASNVHPQHSIYPEFDPRTSIKSDAQWSFQFTKAGRYSYHDHLFANYTGKIIVLDENGDAQNEGAVNSAQCSVFIQISQKQQCWDEQLESVLNTQGLEAAFEHFIALYKTEPDVPKECHGWGHLLGAAGYKLYKAGEDISLRPEAAYCGYGYFHGFIAELIKDTGDVTQTLEFCNYVVRELQDELSSIKRNCVHGVGHGVAAMLIEEPENWGQLELVMDEGLAICEQVYTEKRDLENCYDGVFNESHLELFNHNYGMSFEEFMKLGDPFWYCQRQDERYKESCYFEFSGMFWKIFNYDIIAITEYVIANVHDLPTRGPRVIAKIAADRIQNSIVNPTHEDSIAACAIVPEYLFDSCFEGILNGFIQHGEPSNVHQKGYAFCEEASLTTEENTDCYEKFTAALDWTYTTKQMQAVCKEIPQLQDIQECKKYEL